MPTALYCIPNAKAARSFDLIGREGWIKKRTSSTQPFEVITKDVFTPGSYPVLRERVFSQLDNDQPKVRAITQLQSGEDVSAEWDATIVSRDGTSIFIVWGNGDLVAGTKNPSNKVWTAVINLDYRSAIVTQVVSSGSIDGSVETFDCR